MLRNWFGEDMDVEPSRQESIPIFISTPFIGQGDIINDEWIDGRIALFEAVTLGSIKSLIGGNVYWNLFLGRKPLDKVSEYVEKNLSSLNNVNIITERYSSENITKVAMETSMEESYVTMMIADDDAWPVNYIKIIRNELSKLINENITHAGVTFAHGLEWVMCDQVDIDFIKKSDFSIVRKQNLFEYRFPWVGAGFFILQTKSRPFDFFTVAHPTIPEYLEKSNFASIVLEEPKRCWLYNRHQFADSSIVKSESQPMEYTHEELEQEFGVNSKLLTEWPDSKFSGIYFQKHAQGSGLLEMYEFQDTSDFITMPYKYIFMSNGTFKIKPVVEFNIKGRCRLRVYDETSQRYFILMDFVTDDIPEIFLNANIFNHEHTYKFDFQVLSDSRWVRIMPYVPMKFEEYSPPRINSDMPPLIDFPKSNKYKTEGIFQFIIQGSRTNFIFNLDNESNVSISLHSSMFDSEEKYATRLQKMENGKWTSLEGGDI